jgi:hypothetical protein
VRLTGFDPQFGHQCRRGGPRARCKAA